MKPTGFLFRYLVLPLAASIASCAVGPNFQQPGAPDVALTATPLPANSVVADGVVQHFVTGKDISGEWWQLYHSPELNTLINAALANNPTLEASQATLVQAEENERAAIGGLFPLISGSFQAQRTRLSSAVSATSGAGGSAGNGKFVIPPFSVYNASLSASYPLDVFGGVRRGIENLGATSLYQRYELEAAYLSLTANIVTSAVNEASLQAQIDATNKVIAAEQSVFTILQNQVRLGGAAPAQLLQEQATLASSQASLPPLQSQLAQARNQLAAFVGQFPGNFHEAAFKLSDLKLPEEIPVSIPSSIIAQRPDILASAAQLHEASANVGVADANMLPQITLSANVGQEALSTGTLFMPQNLLWSLVAGVTQPIFDGGTLAARRQAAIAALRVAGAQYQSIVISAFQSVADALEALQYDATTLQAAQTAEDAALNSLRVTQSQYQLGAQPLTAVLTAQTTYQTAAIARVRAQATRLADTAVLFQALGGGWWHRQDVTHSCCGIIP